ncbi:chloroplast acyl carrier protein [Pavlovales sp. CCMP2436]|nr:chloroplast acyl carrier protein [Pavlovales sp. CCMP2436]|mmetsp:Transcript_15624/g.37120  ORF Transcript_15624/g.37120 Transcript_15624/m.37120 type:complete len:116 (+) Transcript_15624:57-404(+)
MLRSFCLVALVAYASAFSAPLAGSRVAISRVAFKGISMNAAVESKVNAIIAEQLGVDLAKVTPNASFTEDLGADSLDAVELIMAMEEAFGVEIPDDEAEKLTTPAQCIALISAKQ